MTDIEDIVPYTLTNNIDILTDIVKDMLNENINEREEMEEFIKNIKHKYSISLANNELLFAYRQYCKTEIKYDKKYELLLQKKSFRSKSGVIVVAVVTSPYPDGQSFSCEWNCSYCPLQPGQPRSYLKEEPGVLRANRHNFDPLLQIRDRLYTYFVNGHPVDKLEIIVLGGTWKSYPLKYQLYFITMIYYAANTIFDNTDVTLLRTVKTLDEEKLINETAQCKIIGLTLETRPDCITPVELIRFRSYGVTRVQIGIQHINNRILERINRKCSIETVIKAIKLLKDNCFKVDGHIMPDLPKPFLKDIKITDNVTHDMIDWEFDMYAEDKRMFDEFVNNPDLQIDQAKIYPFEVVPYTKLKEEYEAGLHKSYAEEIIENPYESIGKQKKNPKIFTKLHELLIYFKSNVPKYIRLNRIIRDIPSQYICGGASDVSMRQVLQMEMKKRNLECKCIRCREVMDKKIDRSTAILSVDAYKASDGIEYFISFETSDKKTLFGFCRLRLTKNAGMQTFMTKSKPIFEELTDSALIRELHVYGQTIEVNNKSLNNNQHSGFGKKLIQKAFDISIDNNFKKIAVISGVGVKNYYRKFGFEDEGYFMIKHFDKTNTSNHIIKYITNIIISIIIIIFLFFYYGTI